MSTIGDQLNSLVLAHQQKSPEIEKLAQQIMIPQNDVLFHVKTIKGSLFTFGLYPTYASQ